MSARWRRDAFLPFSRPTIEDDEVAEVVDSLRTGWITTGPEVARFEGLFRARLGGEHAVAVNSATVGLHLAVAALDLRPGDEVIVPPITWAATANAVELCGGRTAFADVDPDTLCLDPEDTARRITDRTRAIIPVHYAGQPVDLAPLFARLFPALDGLAEPFEVICIDDGSTDVTLALLRAEQARRPQVRALSSALTSPSSPV